MQKKYNSSKNTRYISTAKIVNYSIATACQLHIERKFIVIQNSVKAGKLQIQENCCKTIQSIVSKKYWSWKMHRPSVLHKISVCSYNALILLSQTLKSFKLTDCLFVEWLIQVDHCWCPFMIESIQGDHFSWKPGNVREFCSCQLNVMELAFWQRLSGECQGKNLVRGNLLLQGGPKKTAHYTLVHIFAKYWPIFIILSPTHSVGNLQ